MTELLCRISSTELSEWMAYDRIDPFGNARGDLQAGIVASTVANSMTKKKDGTQFNPVDFMPYVDRPKPDPVKRFKAQMAHLVVEKILLLRYMQLLLRTSLRNQLEYFMGERNLFLHIQKDIQ